MDHNCDYDYKSDFQKQNENILVSVVASKVDKI